MSLRKLLSITVLAVVGLSACTSTGLRDDERLALHRSHAGEPVASFGFFGRLNGWTPLGDSALAVWTRPGEAWLLELSGPCPDLEYTQAIGLTSSVNRVHARFDKVLVHSPHAINMPCFIDTIRPLDVKSLRASEKQLREAQVEAREADAG
jgi:hypothetical protein